MKLINDRLRHILDFICFQPVCGLDIIHEFKLYPGYMYPALEFLENKRLISRSVKDKNLKRVITITPRGREVAFYMQLIHESTPSTTDKIKILKD